MVMIYDNEKEAPQDGDGDEAIPNILFLNNEARLKLHIKTDEEITADEERWAQDETLTKEIVSEVHREPLEGPASFERSDSFRAVNNLRDLMSVKDFPSTVEQY
jgi:hypothetical protein